MDYNELVKRWAFNKHCALYAGDKSIRHKLVDLNQMESVSFDYEEGYRYSEYTADSPEVIVAYQYKDNMGQSQTGAFTITHENVGPFVEEIVRMGQSDEATD